MLDMSHGMRTAAAWAQLELFMTQWRRIEACFDEPGPFIYSATRTTFRQCPSDERTVSDDRPPARPARLAGIQVIIRKERTVPGAQLRLTDAGNRLTAFTTNTRMSGPAGRWPTWRCGGAAPPL
jgi:hypothetical protein